MSESVAAIAPRVLGAELAAEFRPRPAIYWADLLASAALGWGAFALAASLPLGAPLQLLATFAAAVALLRAGYFAHEIAHLSRRAVPGFEFVWHLVAGIPLLTPSLMIGAHKHHHRVATYGTARDPEYAPIARWGAWQFAADLTGMLFVPGLLMLRWGVVGPLSFALPPLRRLVDRRMSTLVMNPRFERDLPRDREWRRWRVQELCTTSFVWSVAAGVWLGAIPPALVGRYWLVLALALVLNEVRTYVAHVYAGDGTPMTIDEQVNDTITLGGWFLVTDLLAPLGDRYHAAHHRYPSLPYHCLPEVHRRLAAGAKHDAVYRSTFRRGLSGALLRLLKRASVLLLLCALVGSAAPARAQLFVDQIFGVSTTSDIVYATGAVRFPFSFDKNLALDLYEPTGAGVPGSKPGLVLIHGGGFISGSKTNATMVALANDYAQRGYVAVSIDYRLAQDDPPAPGETPVDRAAYAAIEDAANAVRWLRANAVTYGIDPDRIAIGGYSAGAITSLGVAYGEYGADAEVQAVVSLSGALFGQESLIDAGEAPLIMLHGTDDLTVPYALALAVQVAALLAPIDLEFYSLSGVGHDVPAQFYSWVVDGVTLDVKVRDFLSSALALAPPKVPVAGPAGWAALVLLLAAAGARAVAGLPARRSPRA